MKPLQMATAAFHDFLTAPLQACAASNDQSAGPCCGIVPGRSKRCSGIPGIPDITVT
jgi:hypothetical protein